MSDEIKEALDLLYSEEPKETYEQREAEKRCLFFKAIGKEDDGRRNPIMTRDEFYAFNKPRKESKSVDLNGKKWVEIYFTFEAYCDVSYRYCFDDDTVYEARSYIGD